MILPPLPEFMAQLPRDARGFPVPWFVHFQDGVPDFRVIRRQGRSIAMHYNLCWICGQPKGRSHAFVIGPMCAVNRVTSEPPSHLECAEFAVKACPFLVQPRMRRNEKNMLAEIVPAAGIHLEHNPGLSCIWITRTYRPVLVDNSFLIQIGKPLRLSWWTQGRPATRGEIDRAIEKGLPFLRQNAQEEGPDAVAELDKYIKRFERLLAGKKA